MKKLTLTVDDFLYDFYKKVGKSAGGLSTRALREKGGASQGRGRGRGLPRRFI